MQLESLAKTTEALDSITAVLNTSDSIIKEKEAALTEIGKSYTLETLKAAIAQSKLEGGQIKTILSANGLPKKLLKTTTNELKSLISSQANAANATHNLGDAFTGLGLKIKNAATSFLSFLNANPIGWAALIVGIIGNVIAGIKQYRKHIAEAAAESRKAADEIANSYKELSAKVSDMKQRYAELAQGVNQVTGENENLNTDEYAEFLDLSNQLAELFPSLTKKYTENGDAILNLSGNVNTITNSLNDLVEAERALANQEIIDKIPAILKGYNQDYSDALKDLSFKEEWKNKLQTAYDSLQDTDKIYFSRDLNSDNDYYQINEVLRELDINYAIVDKSTEYPTSFGLASFSLEDYEDALARISRALETAEKDVSNYNNKIKAVNADFNKYLNTWLSDDWAYISLNDSDLQNVVRDMLFNTDWLEEAKSQGIKTNNWNDVSKWIEDNYILAISNINDDEVKNSLLELYSLPSDDETVQEYTDRLESAFETVQAYCNEKGIKLPISIDDKTNSINDLTADAKAKLQDEFDDRVGELTYEELQIVAGLEISDDTLLSWDELITKIEEAKRFMADTEPQTLFTQLTASQESLDNFQSSVKSASDAYSTLLSGNYSSSELLDSIQAINQAVGDMGGSLNWEFINSQSNSLEVLGNAIEYVSEQYANSILSGAGIDPDSDFGKMLAENIIQAQKAATQLEAVNAQIDSLQEAYQNLTDVVDTYNQYGHITFDQLQNLLSMEPQYLACLIDENGQLQLNQQAMQELANKRLYEAKVQAVQQAISELGTLAHHDEQKAITDSAQAFLDSVDGISAYNEELAKTLTEAGIAAPLIRELGTALSGAEERGASDVDIQTVIDNLSAKMKLINSVGNGDLGNVLGASSSAAEQAETDWKNLLDKETDLLEKQLAANLITFQEYIDNRRQIIEDYYRDGRISAEEYYDALESMYGSQLSLYDKAVNAVTNSIDDEIKRLNEQKEAIENSYQVKIDAIQEEIDALNKANDARKAQIDLEKAQYEAERARSQRVNKVYDGSQFVYAADTEAVRDAEENLADQKTQISISRLEAQIESLEKEMENATKGLDSQIDALESYKEKWNEISGIYEEQQNKLIAAEILGADWESQVLNGRLDTLRSFTEQYIALQQAQVDAAANAAKIKAEADAGNAKGGNVETPPTFYVKKYASGTDHAKRGLNLVGEDGTETFIDNDGNVALVTKPTLIPMEGGEVVKNAEETKAMLDTGNIEPVQSEGMRALFERIRNMQPSDFSFQSLMQPLSAMVNFPNMDYSHMLSNTSAEPTPVVQHITLTLPNVTNNSGADYLIKTLERLPLDNLQHMHRRKR